MTTIVLIILTILLIAKCYKVYTDYKSFSKDMDEQKSIAKEELARSIELMNGGVRDDD